CLSPLPLLGCRHVYDRASPGCHERRETIRIGHQVLNCQPYHHRKRQRPQGRMLLHLHSELWWETHTILSTLRHTFYLETRDIIRTTTHSGFHALPWQHSPSPWVVWASFACGMS